MVDFKSLKRSEELTHFFISMDYMPEIRWLLNQNEIDASECYMRPWRKVLNNQVPEIQHIGEKERNAEIDKYYGSDKEYAERMKGMPAVILSHFDVEELSKILVPLILIEDDQDYVAYMNAERERTIAEGIPEREGIIIINEGA